MIALSPFRNFFLLMLLWLYLLLNYGFMQIRGPLSIPIGELVLLFSLVSINHKTVLPKFLNGPYAIPLLIWWLFGIGRIFWDLPHYGIWAIRDGSHIIESLFIYVGYAYAGRMEAMKVLEKWFPWILGSVALYSLTFPFRESLRAFSPVLPGAQEQSVYLFFAYINTALVMIAFAAYCFQKYMLEQNRKFLAGSILTLTLVLLFFPSRTLFFELFVFLAFWLPGLSLRQFKTIATIITLPIILLALVFASGIPINGRFGTGFELSDYLTVFTEIFQRESDGQHFTSGNEIRFLWWAQVLDSWRHTWLSTLFGMGYGFPLVDFVGSLGAAVREPHNDVISILARGGLVSLVSFFWFQAILLTRSFRLVAFLKDNRQYGPLSVGLLFIILGTLMNAIGESPFIMSLYAIPYYFSAGILLRMYAMRKEYV